MEVLARLAAGQQNKEIARELVVSVGTVKTHTNNIYRKLGVRNRTEALARAQAAGIL
jgi:DNA-binding NarL/FixJ family response regulator